MDKNYKNTFCGILILAILLMSVGYSVLSTRLNVEGTSSITSEFNIQITGINEIMTDGLADTANLDFDATSATYSTNIQSPGDIAVYEITVENKGNLYGYSNPDFGLINKLTRGDNILLGIMAASKTQLTFVDYEDFDTNIYQYYVANPNGQFLLAPGEKAYYYAVAVFNINATELPSVKNYSYEIKFDFSNVNADGTIPHQTLFTTAVTEDNPIITSGNGLYYNNSDGYYYFKSDYASTGSTTVNNYLRISNKIWRIVKFNDNYIYVIEDDDTIHDKQVFSTEADENGYYNNVQTSTLVDTYFWFDYVTNSMSWYDSRKLYYVEDSEIFAIDNNRSGDVNLPSIEEVLNASNSSTCTFANLSNGGCKSWLTDNGNTYLFNEVYASDKTTNTGKIAYLQDGKVIAVDPTDETYGEYKIYSAEYNFCDDVYYITNSDGADGSKAYPYNLDTDAVDNIGPC